MNEKNIELLVVKYLNGTISKTEYQELKSWICQSGNNQLEFDRLREIWLVSYIDNKEFDFDSQAAFKSFQRRVKKIQTTPQIRNRKKRKTMSIPFHWAAVVIVFAVFVGFFSQRFFRNTVEGTESQVAYQEITVPNGARSKILLPDSTYITLNAGTTLRYNTDFGINHRNIWLDGEAYFIVHKSQTPFIVHSGTVQIKAVGTEFNVRAYSSENQIETTLVEGKVMIANTDNPLGQIEEITLLPNQKLIVSKNSTSLSEENDHIVNTKTDDTNVKSKKNIVKQEKVDPIPDVSWKDDEWVIYRESLEDLSVKLERRYNVNIIFVDEHLKLFRYNGTLPDESLEQVLNIMSMVSPVKYTVKGKTVVFSENKEAKRQ